MKLNRILCPIDFSSCSIAANYYASVFAEAAGAEIIYLSVAWPPNNEIHLEDRLDDLFGRLSTKVRPLIHDLRHVFKVRDGDPAREILKFADEHHVDLIIMGTHGRTGSSRLLYGSVCQKVLRRSKCPVMAVKSTVDVGWILPDSEETTTGENEPAPSANQG